MKKAKILTPKQQRFVGEYLIDLNATKAAIRAGYSKKTAKQQGARLLTNVDIQTVIQRAMDERSLRTGIKADRMIAELARIGFAISLTTSRPDRRAIWFSLTLTNYRLICRGAYRKYPKLRAPTVMPDESSSKTPCGPWRCWPSTSSYWAGTRRSRPERPPRIWPIPCAI